MSKGDVKVVMNGAGAKAIMNSKEMQEMLLSKAKAVKDAASLPGYVADVQPGQTRAHAMVKTTDVSSRIDNARHNTLVRSMGAAR